MAIGKIELTGCVVHRGKVQLRFALYLEPEDLGYEVHHVQVPVIPPEGYPGKVDEVGNPVDQADYDNWIDSLPKEWQNNPFHSHFVYVSADVMNADIKQMIADTLNEFYDYWCRSIDLSNEEMRRLKTENPKEFRRWANDIHLLKFWRPKGAFIPGDMSSENLQACQVKLDDIITRVSEFEVKGVK